MEVQLLQYARSVKMLEVTNGQLVCICDHPRLAHFEMESGALICVAIGTLIPYTGQDHCECVDFALACENCDQEIYYDAHLQTWHHEHNGYDRCWFGSERPGKFFGKPKIQSVSCKHVEYINDKCTNCGAEME
jgi:hypothetical protein